MKVFRAKGWFRTAAPGLMLAAAIGAERAEAYPNFIAYGYTSCAVCHFNPLGNGPLTDYGRMVGASVVSDKPFYSRSTTDDELGSTSGFLGRTEKLPAWVRPSAAFRGLLLVSDIQSKSRTRFIPMQLDAGVVLRHPKDKFFAAMSVGYYPSRDQTASADKPLPLISREHYVSYRATKELRVMAGMMDIAYGIRIPDHIAYSRVQTGLAMNDQAHGVLVHYETKDYYVSVNPFIGNLFQASDTRLKGAAGTFEMSVGEKFRVGSSLLYGKNDYRSRILGSVHTRLGFGEGSSWMTEIGFIRQTSLIPTSTLASYILSQGMIRAARGLNFLLTGEFFTEDTFVPSTRLIRFGPTVQYFPMPRLETRLDLATTRSLGGPTVIDDPLALYLQVHLWF